MARRTRRRYPVLLPAAAIVAYLVAGLEAAAQPSIAEKTQGMERHEGYFGFFWDEKEGRIWLEVDRFGEEFLYLESLATGFGSSPIGLDRTQPGRSRIVVFERHGPRVLLVEPNQRFRAITDTPAQQTAVEESFPRSILWGSRVAAQNQTAVLVDATDFVLRDAHDVIAQLRESGQGDFVLDGNRSVVYLPRCKAFPHNVELEAVLTFHSTRPGNRVAEVAPTPHSPSVRQRHSFVRLPDDGYKPRRFDPRAGIQGLQFSDYAAPLDQPLRKRFISRFRLHKREPLAEVSEPVQPIVFYVDPGAPEPIRSAVAEGARWWNQAFEAAGYRDALQVEILPPEADPLDVRYNVIQWVHRSTRGWSYAGSVVDPRSGEIIKGHVQLGSLRVRQDRMLIEGLQPLFPAGEGSGACTLGAGPSASYLTPFDPEVSAVEVALARIRQLSAHEVGHALGFAHNFAASHFGRESVMDYPAPLVRINDDQTLDLSEAYGVGIGEWDKVLVKYAYSHFRQGVNEDDALNLIIKSAFAAGLYFVADPDASSPGTAHAYASLWDNGKDPVAALEHAMKVRRIALNGFGAHNIPAGAPIGELGKVLVPVFLHHRYQIVAAAKLVGGYSYTYKLRDDTLPQSRLIEPGVQKQALAALLKTLGEDVVFPRQLLGLLAPPPYGYPDREEQFPRWTGRIFDPVSATTVAADLTIAVLLHPERASRLSLAGALDPNQPGLEGVIEGLLDATWKVPTPRERWHATAARVVQRVVLDRLIGLGEDARASPGARAIASSKLRDLALHLDSRSVQVGVELAHVEEALRRIAAFLERPHPEFKSPKPPSPPAGEPIGN